MNISMGRIGAIVRTDIHIRFRRIAAIMTLLFVGCGVYLIIPDLVSGRTLMEIGGQRVIYNSAAVALGTGIFCSFFILVAGFYLVSNSVRRDLLSGTGFLIGSSPVSNTEYIIGKFCGNALYLAVVMLMCLGSSMIMFLLRGERAIEPLVFLWVYAWLTIPAIIFTAAAAIAFESLPLLSGRFGDVVYFFLWGAIVALPIPLMDRPEPSFWAGTVDYMGLVSVVHDVRTRFHTNALSIGMTPFKPENPPLLYSGFSVGYGELVQRLCTCAIPAVFLAAARLWFHRFNPVRTKHSALRSKGNFIVRINRRLKPLTAVLSAATIPYGREPSFPAAVYSDFICSLALSPVTVLAIVICAVLSLSLGVSEIQHGLLPVITGIIIVACAEIATRDRNARSSGFLFTAPGIRQHYIPWKFLSGTTLTFAFTLIPLIRLAPGHPSAALSLFTGSLFLTASAVGAGIITGSPKLFIGSFLMLLYIALNAVNEPVFDFAGFNGTATLSVQAAYVLIAAIILLIAQLRHRYSSGND